MFIFRTNGNVDLHFADDSVKKNAAKLCFSFTIFFYFLVSLFKRSIIALRFHVYEKMNRFELFKPVCVDLLKSPSFDSLSKLKILIFDSESSSINELQEYILFPLFFITSNNTR